MGNYQTLFEKMKSVNQDYDKLFLLKDKGDKLVSKVSVRVK